MAENVVSQHFRGKLGSDPSVDADGLLPEIRVSRKAMTVGQKYQRFQHIDEEERSISELVADYKDSWLACSLVKVWAVIARRLPILKWLPAYKFKECILGDVIAGITISIMNIPQGMAYALLAGVSPVYGLYTALFPVFIYVLFGTSKHTALGTFAVVCLMTGKVVDRIAVDRDMILLHNSTVNGTESGMSEGFSPIQVASIVCLTVGLWELALGFLQLGSLCVFLSDTLVSGFTTGAACHVFTSQVKSLLGISVPMHNGPFKLIFTYYDIFKNIASANVAVIIVSLMCIILLVINNEFVKPRVRKHTKLPIPIELIVVILGTGISYAMYFDGNYKIDIVGPIPTGLPEGTSPPVDLFGDVLVESFVIAVVSFTISFSLAKMFAKKKNYSVDATQELYAHGLSNIFGSFFKCVPMSTSLSRSLIQMDVGGMTQLSSIFLCGIMLLIVLFIAPVFRTLPNCVLASIIVVSLKGMFLQVYDMLHMWNKSRVEALVWIITFLSVFIIDVDYGLLIGCVLSVVILLVRGQRQTVKRLGQVPDTDIFLSINEYSLAKEVPGFRVCQFTGSLHFANCETFQNALIDCSEMNPRKILKQKRKEEKRRKKENCWAIFGNCFFEKHGLDNEAFESIKMEDNRECNARQDTIVSLSEERLSEGKKHHYGMADIKGSHKGAPKPIQWLVLDLSAISFIDMSGCRTVVNLYKDYREAGVTLVIAGASEQVMDTLRVSSAFGTLSEDEVFHSVQDAISILSQRFRSPVAESRNGAS